MLTGWLASRCSTDTPMQPNYKVVFVAAGVGMLLSLVWFWFGRRQLGASAVRRGARRHAIAACCTSLLGALRRGPGRLLPAGDSAPTTLQCVLARAVRRRCALMLLIEGIREGPVQRDKVIAMLIIFAFNMLFWMFFEQAGSSFTFLADKIVDRRCSAAGCSRSAGSSR